MNTRKAAGKKMPPLESNNAFDQRKSATLADIDALHQKMDLIGVRIDMMFHRTSQELTRIFEILQVIDRKQGPFFGLTSVSP